MVGVAHMVFELSLFYCGRSNGVLRSNLMTWRFAFWSNAGDLFNWSRGLYE